MWEWREDTARGRWRLEDSGSWSWDEPSPLARVGAGADVLLGEGRPGGGGWTPPPVGDGWDPTPIFRAVATDREAAEAARRIPEPHPGSGPFPAPYRDAADAGHAERRGLEARSDSEEEMRRRAERRRRPHSAEPVGSEPVGYGPVGYGTGGSAAAGRHGRHALLARDEALAPPSGSGGRHVLRS